MFNTCVKAVGLVLEKSGNLVDLELFALSLSQIIKQVGSVFSHNPGFVFAQAEQSVVGTFCPVSTSITTTTTGFIKGGSL